MQRFALILASCAGFYFLLFLLFRSVTDVGELRTRFPRVIYDPKTETASIEIVKQRPASWVGLNSISPIATSAIMISEDWAFWQHNGFDWEQLWDAMETNLKKGRFARGGSTITQQVIKNVYLSNEKTVVRKLKEAVLTMRIERHVSKKRILEIYLNIVEFGPGLYGIGPASRYYFQKAPSQLNAREGAYLAMLLPSPKRYSVSYRKRVLTPYALATMRGILAKLYATHRLTEGDYRMALASPLGFESMQLPMPETIPDDEDEAEEPQEEITVPQTEAI
ncbi:MAG TPA: monofunctional biosynthetic peptidoglycan transglycosylase [Bdellovibrionota bacterium]|jgi:monofunctional biosynthetic peptidoglycan transglycosylase